MEELAVNGKSIMVLSKEEIEREIAKAALDHREADFSKKTIKEISLAGKNMDHGINLSDTLIAGDVFLADATIGGNLNLANSVINGSLFLASGKLMGDLILENTWIGQTLNMAGSNVTGSLRFNQARINGFISLDKAVILGDIDFSKIEAHDYCQGNLRIKGNIFLRNAQINGYLNLSDALSSGDIDLENALVRRMLTAKNSDPAGSFILKETIYEKENADFSGIPPEKIAG